MLRGDVLAGSLSILRPMDDVMCLAEVGASRDVVALSRLCGTSIEVLSADGRLVALGWESGRGVHGVSVLPVDMLAGSSILRSLGEVMCLAEVGASRDVIALSRLCGTPVEVARTADGRLVLLGSDSGRGVRGMSVLLAGASILRSLDDVICLADARAPWDVIALSRLWDEPIAMLGSDSGHGVHGSGDAAG